ncbi:MAG: valine--tRNA ligase [Minisyncoccia bacterium]
MNETFLSPYNPGATEEKIYKLWEESGFFNPDICVEKRVTDSNADYFSIALPPPNVTGTLHLGHAFEDTLQDITARYKRMQGLRTLWIPGTDHAPIATEAKVAKMLEKDEGKRKQDFEREDFVKKVEKFAQESHDTIVDQVRRIGASLDWSREAFTFDEKRNLAVRTIFKKMYDDGLIYRGNRIVNWDPKGQTTISDDEIVYIERKSKLYTFKYSPDFPIAISTTRLETKVGDTAVAVHPEDKRYTEYVGKTYEIEDFAGEKLSIKIITDKEVDPEFGTGALGVTPAHSMVDWEMAQKNSLAVKQVINEYSKMTVNSPILSGKKTTEAREAIADWLKEKGLLIEEKEIDQNVSTAERTGAIIEPLPKLQWFLNVNKEFTYAHENLPDFHKGQIVTLKQLMLSVVENKSITILPENFEKIYRHWINNLRDWCISRQLWYGHRVPVWYRGVETYCGINKPEGDDWVQDSDTLDTWFSSGLWTFSTLGWPENSLDLEKYHPTSFMSPGYEILQLWVSRMILMSTYAIGQIPFRHVYIHGIVRDSKGQKFSKSQGNGVDPIDVINEYGADALRMALIVGVGPGADSKFDFAKVKAYKNFANKIWNITRYVLTSTENFDGNKPEKMAGSDAALIQEFDSLATDVTTDMDNYRFYLAAEKLYHYVWHTFADKILEESKEKLKSEDLETVLSAQYTLKYILENSLKLLHPFMPFITEEIWSYLPYNNKKMLMVTKWPQ